VENFMNRYFVDLLPIARSVVFPATGYSIKTLAPLAGFNWEASDASGALSMTKFQTAVSTNSSPQDKADAIKWLREYNRDDVKATFAVREYLRGLSFD
jgi:predicted RecB family nuclease